MSPEQLRTPDERAAYLDAWLTEAPDDSAGVARALGDIARSSGVCHNFRRPEFHADAEKSQLEISPLYESIRQIVGDFVTMPPAIKERLSAR